MFELNDYEEAKGCLNEIEEKMTYGDYVNISSDILWEISRLLKIIIKTYEKEIENDV